MIDRLAQDLLGGDVAGGAEHRSGLGERRLRRRHLGDAEVHELDLAAIEHADVARLEVAVIDALGVGVGDRLRHLDQDRQRACGRRSARAIGSCARGPRRRGTPRPDSTPASSNPQSKPRTMLGWSRLPAISASRRKRRRRSSSRLGADLDRDHPLHQRVARAVDGREAAATDRLEHLVLPDALGYRHDPAILAAAARGSARSRYQRTR